MASFEIQPNLVIIKYYISFINYLFYYVHNIARLSNVTNKELLYTMYMNTKYEFKAAYEILEY